MILPSKTKIMIVPDSGGSADSEAMVALKTAIEAQGEYAVKVIDLSALVRGEHEGEELTDSKIIELSARKLEQLSECKGLVWDGSNDATVPEVKTIKLTLKNRRSFTHILDPEIEQETASPESKPDTDSLLIDDEPIDIDDILSRINDECSDWEQGAPDTIVVFGKSAMLAGGIGRCDVLFVNPEYVWEWPWKKQYYVDQKQARLYWEKKCDYEKDPMETVLWCGTERSGRHNYSRRYGIVTNADYIGDFWDRYPQMSEVARELDGDAQALAKFICEFADDKMTNPLEEVYEALKNLQWKGPSSMNEKCRFAEPVKLSNFTVLGICFGAPMANGQSCNKLKIAERDWHLPLESVQTRRELNLLRDAIVQSADPGVTKKVAKRILIVPDYFTPYNSPNIKELHSMLKQMGYYVAVFVPGNTLEQSRQGLERRCKVNPFDLIVTVETGCLIATRVANCPRIFVNPDWAAWEWMGLRLGEDKKRLEHRGIDKSGPFFDFYLNNDEIAVARQMAERAYIKRGPYPAYGWFTEDAVDSHLPEEHLKRFNTSAYIPGLRLDTEEGLAVLAKQIDNILTVESDE